MRSTYQKNITRIKVGLLLAFVMLLSAQFSSCKKYLEKKPLQTLVIPKTLDDLQALLDNNSFINQQFTPGLAEVVSDNYYITNTVYQSLSLDERLNYIWDKDAQHLFSWRRAYQGPIYYSNIVLDVLPGVQKTAGNEVQWNAIKGSALFYRAFGLLQLAQIYCAPYSSAAANDLGLVLKTNAEVTEGLTRATVQQTYDQIIGDLTIAADLLPATALYPTRPNKAAVFGALARTYLSMRDYVNAGRYADLCLQQYNTLMDYNAGSITTRFNPETIYYSWPHYIGIMSNSKAMVDTSLYKSYATDDLRRTLFFNNAANGNHSFKGSYSGTAFVCFDGIATDEIYLIRAECYARAGNKDAALADLNTLMKKRWKNTVPYPTITAISADEAKNKILTERRKELLWRGLRWSDIRRFNLEGANITLTRFVNGTAYTLPAGSLNWVMQIPREEVNLSGIQQNPR